MADDNSKQRGRVRLVDVAKRAGVSMKSVSNVVRAQPHVSDELRERVQAAIDELDYRPNLTARQLATGRTGMLALALPFMDQPYFAELSRQVAQQAPDFGYRVLIEQTLNDAAAERAVLQDRHNGLVDGIIFNPSAMSTQELEDLHPDFPLVLVGEGARPANADHVMIDNVAAARDLTSHLIERGRRRIAFLGLVQTETGDTNDLRRDGYLQAHAEHGLTVDPDLILTCPEYSLEASRAVFAAIVDSGVDAVVCRDEQFAKGAHHAMHDARLRIPDDIAIVAWDDTFISQLSVPALTVAGPDKRELARTALSFVHDRINGYRGPGRHVIVAHQVTVRHSS